jgi:MoaA/NifB/PqqE/SkfB family radical SAM enzyme
MDKIFEKILEEYEAQELLGSAPAVMSIESVNGCPFTCSMCKSKPTETNKISKELLNKIEPYFKNLDILGIHGQGEPLLADMEYFVEQSIKNDFIILMDTTGYLLSKKMADLLLKARLSVKFSVHGATTKTYQKIMGVNLEKVKDNIKYLINSSKENNYKNDFWFSFIVMKENIDEIENLLYLAHDCGVKNVRFMRLDAKKETILGLNIRDFKFNYFDQTRPGIINKFKNNFLLYSKIAKDLGITIQDGSINEFNNEASTNFREISNKITYKVIGKKVFPIFPIKGNCIAPWIGQIQVRIDGNVTLCCAPYYDLGNLNDFAFDKLWNSNKMLKIRSIFKRGYLPSLCGYCRGMTIESLPNNSYFRKNK